MKKIASVLSFIRSVNYIKIGKEILFFSKFFLLVVVFLIFQVLKFLGNKKLLFFWAQPLRKFVSKVRTKTLYFFNTKVEGEISSLDLITLATRHLSAKKTRTMITIGGMSVGFGSVIFLLSLGYGTQKLVISRVARLGEMKQIIVTVGQASSLRMNDQTIEEFAKIENVESVLPVASVVSKINYNNSISDAIAYAVTKKFLEESAIQPTKGELFDDKDITTSSINQKVPGTVAGVQTERYDGAKMNKQISQIKYSLYPQTWKPVYSEPSSDSEIIGYTTRVVGEQDAVEVWGQEYDAPDIPEGYDVFNNSYSPWIKDTFPLWRRETCTQQNYDCVDDTYVVMRTSNNQSIETGYIKQTDLSLSRYRILSDEPQKIEEGAAVASVEFTLPKNVYEQIYSDSFKNAELTTIFTNQEKETTIFTGELIFGESYYDPNGWGNAGKNPNGKELGYWIRAKLPLWRKLDCRDCVNLYLKEVDQNEKQVEAISYIKASKARIENLPLPPLHQKQTGSVLGIASDSAQIASGSALIAEEETEPEPIITADGSVLQSTLLADGTIDWVSISSGSAGLTTQKRDIIPFSSGAQRVAIVNSALLSVFTINEADALGQKFTTTFTLDEEFFDEPGYQAESEPVEYKIIGIIPDNKTPAYYVPFNDIKALGIKNYSQVKVVVFNQNDLKVVRQTIESLGYKTTSVVDTVGKINSLFSTVRFVLSLLGFVALGVAALGMFNTLTVSLLEKTREVGLMKAIGMKSNEIQRLFLAESIIMGLTGGFFGLILGYVTGQVLSLLFSIISVTKGLGLINFVDIPLILSISIITLSFIIGIATGLYPSYRATKISALNALRYE